MPGAPSQSHQAPNVNIIRWKDPELRGFQVAQLQRGGVGLEPVPPAAWITGCGSQAGPRMENNRPWPGASVARLRVARKRLGETDAQTP